MVASTGSSGARLARNPGLRLIPRPRAPAMPPRPRGQQLPSGYPGIDHGSIMPRRRANSRVTAPDDTSRRRAERPRQPQGPTEPAGARRGNAPWPAIAGTPRAPDWCRRNVAIAIAGRGPSHVHLLMPAVLTAHGSGCTGKVRFWWTRDPPPHARGVWIRALEGPDPWTWPHPPLPRGLGLEVDEGRRPALAAHLLAKPPPAEVMRAGDDPGRMDSVTQTLSTK